MTYTHEFYVESMTYTHEFYVERVVDGEDIEFKLQVELEVEPLVRGRYSGPPEHCYPDEGGCAQIDGPVLVMDGDGDTTPWEGTLTEDEISKVEKDAFEAWSELDIDDYYDDDAVLSGDYDEFHDDRAIHIGNGRKLFY